MQEIQLRINAQLALNFDANLARPPHPMFFIPSREYPLGVSQHIWITLRRTSKSTSMWSFTTLMKTMSAENSIMSAGNYATLGTLARSFCFLMFVYCGLIICDSVAWSGIEKKKKKNTKSPATVNSCRSSVVGIRTQSAGNDSAVRATTRVKQGPGVLATRGLIVPSHLRSATGPHTSWRRLRRHDLTVKDMASFVLLS